MLLLLRCCLMPEFHTGKGFNYKGWSDANGLHSAATLVAATGSASIDNGFHAWLLLVGHCVHSPSAAVLLNVKHEIIQATATLWALGAKATNLARQRVLT